jgi:hypothetical protein
VRQAGSEAVLEGQKQDKIAPGLIVSTLPKTARGQKEGQISACREAMTDYAVSIVFCSLHMLVAEMGF